MFSMIETSMPAIGLCISAASLEDATWQQQRQEDRHLDGNVMYWAQDLIRLRILVSYAKP